MAYVFGFPSDVTDAIMGMRDWRWEMVRDGGKTPSASCVNPCPLHDLYREPMTHHMDTNKEYIAIIRMPEFQLLGHWCVPDSELHPNSRRQWLGEQGPTIISLLRYVLKQPRYPGEENHRHWRGERGKRGWRTVRQWKPGQSVDSARLGG